MKIIELLNKIVNGELNEDTRFCYDHYNGYKEYINVRQFFDRYIVDKENLDLEVEVEIIENTPKEDKKIKKLDYVFDIQDPTYKENWLMCCIEANKNKINEIIDKLEGGK